MNKSIITLILVCIALLYSCQEREKHIYCLPTSAHLAELEQQERAYKDSLDKYCSLLDTAQLRHYLALHQAARDTCSVVLREEANAFIAAVEEDAANERNNLTTTERILIYVAFILLISLLIYLGTVNRLWTRIGWFFQDMWKWFKETDSLVTGPCFGKENLSDEEIHEIMNIIHKGNPPKYEIKRDKDKAK